jgi:hypothetical protein
MDVLSPAKSALASPSCSSNGVQVSTFGKLELGRVRRCNGVEPGDHELGDPEADRTGRAVPQPIPWPPVKNAAPGSSVQKRPGRAS